MMVMILIFFLLLGFVTLTLMGTRSTGGGKTVLSSTGEIGWHLKECSDGRKPELERTNDPRIFGPIIWPGLHIMAENYPEKADKYHRTACVNFLEGLPWMLPCGDCGSHLLKRESSFEGQVDALIKDDKAALKKKENLTRACQSRKALRSFLVEAHNNVSKNNKKPVWTVDQARQRYCQIPVCLEPCNTYKQKQCQKTVGCVWNKDTCQPGWFEDGLPYPKGKSCLEEEI